MSRKGWQTLLNALGVFFLALATVACFGADKTFAVALALVGLGWIFLARLPPL